MLAASEEQLTWEYIFDKEAKRKGVGERMITLR